MSSALGELIAAVKAGDANRVLELLKAGADVHEQDDQGWSPLNWAAGRGDAEVVRLLLEWGADPTKTGRDHRTPLMIAKAAGHEEVTAIITEAEKERGVWADPRLTRPYCKAYYLESLRSFDEWPEATGGPDRGEAGEAVTEDGYGDPGLPTGQSIVYIHHDFTVTRSMWHGEDIVFDTITPKWKSFCERELEFAVPRDLL